MSQQDEERRELKPCPFCGGEAWLRTDMKTTIGFKEHDLMPSIECANCGCGTGHDSLENVVASWNRRAPEHEKAAPMAHCHTCCCFGPPQTAEAPRPVTAGPVAQCNCGMGAASGQYHHDKCPRFNQFPDRRSPAQEPDYWLRAYHLSRQLSDHLLATPADPPRRRTNAISRQVDFYPQAETIRPCLQG